MAIQSILASFSSKPQFVATNEAVNSTTPMWEDLAVISVDIQLPAAVTEEPIAVDSPKDEGTNQAVAQQDLQAIKIIQPVSLKVTALTGNLSTLENILATFFDPTVTVSVTTKSIITDHLVLTDIELVQSADLLSATKVVLTFEQTQAPSNAGYDPAQAANASTYGIGIQNPASTPFSALGGAINDAISRVPELIPGGPLIDQQGGIFILDASKLA